MGHYVSQFQLLMRKWNNLFTRSCTWETRGKRCSKGRPFCFVAHMTGDQANNMQQT